MCIDSSSSKLDGKCQAVKISANTCNRRRVRVAQTFEPASCRRPLHEQLDGGKSERLFRGEVGRFVWCTKRRKAVNMLTLDAKGFATGGEDVYVIGLPDDTLYKRCYRFD